MALCSYGWYPAVFQYRGLYSYRWPSIVMALCSYGRYPAVFQYREHLCHRRRLAFDHEPRHIYAVRLFLIYFYFFIFYLCRWRFRKHSSQKMA